jgi:hypothetical protein
MIRREMLRRVERLETRIGLKRQQLKFTIHFVEPDGTVSSTLLLHGRDEQEHLARSEYGQGGRRDCEH